MILSIITVNLNNASGLRKTVNSIEQLITSSKITIESVIIDGDSKDESVDVIHDFIKHNPTIDVKYLSEPDNGVYDAMNKGINLASGDYAVFMNSGDEFANNDFLDVFNSLDESVDVIYGDSVLRYREKYYASIVKDTIYFGCKAIPFCHQSGFFKVSLLKQNYYSLEYKIAGDYELVTRLLYQNRKFMHINKYISVYDIDGLSSRESGLGRIEKLKIQKYYGIINAKEYFKQQCVAKFRQAIRKMYPQKLFLQRKQKQYENTSRYWCNSLEQLLQFNK